MRIAPDHARNDTCNAGRCSQGFRNSGRNAEHAWRTLRLLGAEQRPENRSRSVLVNAWSEQPEQIESDVQLLTSDLIGRVILEIVEIPLALRFPLLDRRVAENGRRPSLLDLSCE